MKEERIKEFIHYFIPRLLSKDVTQHILTDQQFFFIFPQLAEALTFAEEDIVNKAVSIYCNWILATAPGNSTEIKNKYYRIAINDLYHYCEKNENTTQIELIADTLQSIVLKPPCEFENNTWILLMEILPKFAVIGNNEATKDKIWRIAMEIFILSGLSGDQITEMIKSRSVNKAWQHFVGDLVVSAIAPENCRPRFFSKGVWSKDNQTPADFAKSVLDILLEREMTPDVRRMCFFGVAESLQSTSTSIVGFDYNIESVITSFADVIFPLSQIGIENTRFVFDFFANGRIQDDSEWLTVLKTNIITELRRLNPSDSFILVQGMSSLLAHRPAFVAPLVREIAHAIQGPCIPSFNPEWCHFCTSLAEMESAVPSVDGLPQLLSICTSKLPETSAPLHRLFLSFIKRSGPILTNSFLLYTAFAPHFAEGLVPALSILSLLENATQFPPQKRQLLLLTAIENLATTKSLSSDPEFLLTLAAAVEHGFESFPFLKGFLENMIAVPARLQVAGADIASILEKPAQMIRFRSGIVSASYDPDGTATAVFRNRYSMSVFKIDPTRPPPGEALKLPPPEAKGDETDPPSFEPYVADDSPEHDPDTFGLIASLGLFSADNRARVEILKENEIARVRKYERLIGRAGITVALARVSGPRMGLFEAAASSSAFNEFTRRLGSFERNAEVGGVAARFPTPKYDTALFRFEYISPLHFSPNDRPRAAEALSKNRFLVVFNEFATPLVEPTLEKKLALVIEIGPALPGLYRMIVHRAPTDLMLPFNIGEPRLVSAANVGDEIALLMFMSVGGDVQGNYASRLEEFYKVSDIFNTDSAPENGIKLLADVFKKL